MFDEGAYAGPKPAGSLAELGTWRLIDGLRLAPLPT